MVFFFVSVLAGILTVLAPCIFPLLPIVIGSSQAENRSFSSRSIVVISSLTFSVIIFTLLLKASTLLIAVPQSFWSVLSGTIIILVGLAILFPIFWASIPFVQKITLIGDQTIKSGLHKNSYLGDVLIGLALGPVFTTCSPTYLFIVASILPVGLISGLIYLVGFTLGLAVSLLTIAYFGGQVVRKVASHMVIANRSKQLFGLVIILVGFSIITGFDKKLQTYILDSGYGATIFIEDSLIEKYAPINQK